MSEPENAPVAEEVAEEGAPPKKNFKKLILMVVVLLAVLGGGGGGAYYFFVVRPANAAAAEADPEAEGAEEPKADKKKAKKKPKVEEEEEEEESAGGKKPGSLKSALPKDEDVKTVIELPPFIVNLADTDNSRYLRMTVSLGVGGDEEGGEHEKPDQLFMTRVRNAMLAVIADKKSDEILNVEGKANSAKNYLRPRRPRRNIPM